MANYARTFDRACLDIESAYTEKRIPLYNEDSVVYYIRWWCEKRLGKVARVESKGSYGKDIQICNRFGQARLYAEVKMARSDSENYSSRKKKYFHDIERLEKKVKGAQRRGRFVIFDKMNSIEGTNLERDLRKKCKQSDVKLIIMKGTKS